MGDKTIRTKPLHATRPDDDLKDKTPGERMEMVWQLTLDAWAFKESLDAEPRLQRHIVVFRKRKG